MSFANTRLPSASVSSSSKCSIVRGARSHASSQSSIDSNLNSARRTSFEFVNTSLQASTSESFPCSSVFSGNNRRAVEKLRRTRAASHHTVTRKVLSVAAAAMSTAPAVVPNVLKTVTVALGDRSYPIFIGNGLLNAAVSDAELLRKHIPGKRVLIVTNETIAPLYLEKCTKALTADGKLQVDTVILPDGEAHKNMEVLQMVWDKALECRMDRGTTFLALGGGVIGDMTGFAAACYQRGVHFVQIPTTVMSQVDSSVGGKTGVNHPLGKNMIGAFYQPLVVLIDSDTLSTLPDRELASGISEIIKYGLIRDAPLFCWLEENMDKLLARDTEAIAYAIERSCINKAEVVAADEKETNDVRATLNLGHTFGHAIETATGYGTWLHGEAVAAGTCMAADLSYRLGWIDGALRDRTVALLARARLPIAPPATMTNAQFRSLMAVDKKVAAGKLRLVLLKGALGGCVVTGEFDAEKLEETLEHFCSKK
ncbi:hypothetical protein CEUSTIGMA_g11075.t1 [Chlamydomonas eustigma]|uniref:3-dehydroquinate synthase, chloroplastic n=1 Tax=Chlamydomonas eustigma TaxID=1157962 RepID=A0A250XLI9_9CHLO|nr:hypothetical protein CEUSTIGMA_g11075.t1 [Chlamydomonas eustigma]|eukprot:GAX83650.1 hypothetical protein CEUSTIGMA_g11075.t1 [Chlamydomonas eustigma]